MRKTINIGALVFFAWLVFDSLNIMNMLLSFILAGEIPGLKVALPPTIMLAIFTAVALFCSFEFSARRFETARRARQTILGYLTSRFGRQPDGVGRA